MPPRKSVWTPERVLLLVLLVTTVIYWRDLSHDFILDDVPLVLMNATITTWRNLPTIFRSDIFHVTGGAIHYRPVYISWFLLNHSLFGMVLPWWHLTSLLLHLVITLLVYRVGVKILRDNWQAAFAAAVFAVHPIHAEPVAYLTAATDLLVALFTLLALLLYFRFRDEGGHARDLIVSVICAAAAMLAKESAGMFPWMLVAYEALQPKDGETRGWKRYVWTLPYFAVGAAYVVVRTAMFGLNAGPGPGGNRLAAFLDVPLVMLIYCKNLLAPTQLSFFYPIEWSADWTWARAALIVLVCAALVLLWRRQKDRPTVRLLLVWAGILFVPPALAVGAFIRDEWVHDRHVYLALAPLCMLLAVLLGNWIRRPRTLAITGAVIVGVLAVGSWYQVPRFQDEVTVYSSALRLAPNDPELHRYYASALWKYNRKAQALQEYRTSIALRPESSFAYEEYASALSEIGKYDEALQEYKLALARVKPGSGEQAEVLYRVATLETRFSELDSAKAHLHKAIELAPKALNFHAALADVLQQQGDTTAAKVELRLEAINRKEFLDRRKATGH